MKSPNFFRKNLAFNSRQMSVTNQPIENRSDAWTSLMPGGLKMRRAKIALLVVVFACLSLTVVAQKEKPQTPPAQNPIDDNRMEKAHESLFAPQALPGANAS